MRSSDSLAVLITYSDATSPPSHALVLLSVHRSNPPIVDRIISISFISGQDQRLLDIPRLVIPTGSTMAFVRFGSAVVMVSLDFGASNTLSLSRIVLIIKHRCAL